MRIYIYTDTLFSLNEENLMISKPYKNLQEFLDDKGYGYKPIKSFPIEQVFDVKELVNYLEEKDA
jgi:hypothetical protein